MSDASLAYALSDLAVASGNTSLVEQIPSVYPDARTSALLRMGEYQSAWEAAADIARSLRTGTCSGCYRCCWGTMVCATQITVPLYRDLALRDVIRKSGNAALVDSISSPYYKVQALTALGEYEAAQAIGR